MKTKLLLAISIFALLIFAFGGNKSANDAASSGSNAPNKTAKKRVGVTLLTREDDFYRELEAGLREAAAKNDFELIVQSGDKDLSKQQSQIDNFLVQKVDAIIVSPTDTKGIAPAIERANAANVPVFTADIAAGGGRGSVVSTLFGTIFIGVLNNGLNLVGVDAYVQKSFSARSFCSRCRRINSTVID